MDTITATREVERAAQLRKKIAALNERKGELESKHAKERAALAAAEGTRLALIKELAGADAATEGWANSEIDNLDSLLVTLGRKVSALESALAAVAVELEPFTRELAEVHIVIRAQERAAQLKAFTEKLRYAAEQAEKDLNRVRESLSTLTRLGADGVAAFDFDAQRICEQVFADFSASQTNLDARGWRPASPSYTRLEFVICPLTRM